MKRVVSSSIITLFIIAAVAVTFFYLRNYRLSGTDPKSAVPDDAAFFFVADLSEFAPESLIGPANRKAFGITPAFIGLENNIRWFDSLLLSNDDFHAFSDGSKIVLSAQVTGAKSFDYLFVKSLNKKFDDETVDRMMTTVLKQEQHLAMREYDGVTVREVMENNKVVFAYAMVKGLFLASKTAFLVEDGIRQARSGKSKADTFSLLESENAGSGLSVFLNFKKLGSFLGTMTDPAINHRFGTLDLFGDWASADISMEEETISMNGTVLCTDSMTYTACLDGQTPEQSVINTILPARTAFFRNTVASDRNLFLNKLRSVHFSDSQKKRLQKLEITTSDTYDIRITAAMDEITGSEFALLVTEPSGSSYENNSYAIFTLSNPDQALKKLQQIKKAVNTQGARDAEEYRGCSIGQIMINQLIPTLYGDEYGKIKGSWYAVIGKHIVFANQQASLRLLIDDLRSGYLLANTPSYKSILEKIPAKNNFTWYVKPGSSMSIFRNAANDLWKSYTDKYRDAFTAVTGFCFTLNAGNGIHRFNAIAGFSGGDAPSGMKQILTIDTDTSVSLMPLITSDPRNGNKQIMFQDDANTVYLCDNTGNVIWKETIGGKIEGEIFEIDLFKNNLRQFLFNTREHLYLLDENGKPVGNYPIRLPAPASNGLSVYDFEGRKDPRLYIACENNQVYAYLPSGKPMPGWSLGPLQGPVKRKIDHVRIQNKDLLLISDESGGLQVVTKFGEPGITLTEKFVLAEHSIVGSKDDGTMVMTDRSGNIRIADATGKVETIPLNAAGEDHGFAFADVDNDGNKDFVFADDDEVTAYNSSLTMIFRQTFETKLTGDISFHQNEDGSKFLCVRSTESDQTWILTTNGELFPGSPLQGSGKPLFGNTGNDGKLHLLIGGKGNYFRIYGVE